MEHQKWTNRGSGSCPSCKKYTYANRYKPPKCPDCGYDLGGCFTGTKKVKKNIPDAVFITENIFSVRTSNQGDRCLVCKDDDLWICLHEKCKERRAAYHASARLEEFSCAHIQKASHPLSPQASSQETSSISNYPCSPNVKADLESVIDMATKNNHPLVVQVSDNMYCVYGPPSASNTVGYCHIKHFHEKKSFVCTGKDCRGIASKGKQARTKAICIHLHILYSSMKISINYEQCQNELPLPESAHDQECSENEPVSRVSTLQLAEMEDQFPYIVPRPLLQKIMQQDACSMCGVPGGWPEKIYPADDKCRLCGGNLGNEIRHSGQRGKVYLISELNPFKIIDVYVKLCQIPTCKAMNRAILHELGLFNICDKVLVTYTILVEFREHFKKGHPIGNVIEAKLAALKQKCREELTPSPNELSYIAELLYNGFYGYEMLVARDLDTVICGLCGVCPEVCLGDGNEKNSCKNDKIKYPVDCTERKEMIPMASFLDKLKRRWIEKTVYTRTNKAFSVSVEEIPPFVAPSIASEQTINSEIEKKSVYLTKDVLGDQARIYSLLTRGELNMETIRELPRERLIEISQYCDIPTSGKSKELLIGSLQQLYSSLLIGNSPCHGFSKIPGRTGGFYHIVCRHGCTYASKFLCLTESVRDAADLYMSLMHKPNVFICDTPCGFVRHLRCRSPDIADQLWGNKEGCFETPTLDKKPTAGHDVPELIVPEFQASSASDDCNAVLTPFQHPISKSSNHYILGDRFHNTASPHKSPLCLYHDVNLATGSNTLKTSIQESQNFRKNARRLRSAGQQQMEVHIAFNYLMDFYQNEETVQKQLLNLEQGILPGQRNARNNWLRFVICNL